MQGGWKAARGPGASRSRSAAACGATTSATSLTSATILAARSA
ncbi:Uncharacterised protein [Bordetella pertussis]|nr:Uncharacterised protein [Bordetella pertussis]